MQHIEQKFEKSLLNAAIEDKVKYFDRKVIAHPHLQNATDLALENIKFADHGELVSIVGPTGVGTTQLGRKLWQSFTKSDTTQCDEFNHPPYVPAIGVNAPSCADRTDKDYWKRLLAEILRCGGDILIDHKIYVPPTEFNLTSPIPWFDSRKQSLETMMMATVNMLARRQAKILLINQADRLFQEKDQAGSSRSQQVLMDIASQTQTRIVLLGGYPLARATCARNNWIRRQHMVHLRRYDRNDPAEYSNFVRALFNFLGHMPINQRLPLPKQETAMELYIRTVGCVGALKQTLLRVLHRSLQHGENLTDSLILRFAPDNAVALGIAREARIGEEMLLDVSTSEVERLLDGPTPSAAGTSSASGSDRKPPKNLQNPGKGNLHRRRIGERTTSRDPVGDQDANRQPRPI